MARGPSHALGGGGGLSRRALLGALALAGLAATDARTATLASIGRRAGVRFGTAMRATTIDDPALAALIAAQCASITPELEMKWAALAPTAQARDWVGADALVDWAKRHGLTVRGHALLWHRSVPAWWRPDLPWSVVDAQIGETIARFQGVRDWDVVNEPIAPDGDGLRATPFVAAYGTAYVADGLRAARAAAPRARLFVNDYDLEYALPDQARRRAALLALVERLRREGAPLDGVGIQAHLTIGRPFDAGVFTRFLDALAGLGLVVAITELDVKERDYILSAPARDAAVAEHAAPFLAAALRHPAVRSLTCWGLSDRRSWLEVTPEDRARFPGAWADGSSPGLNRGLPYDSDGRPKPLREAIAHALIDAPYR